MPRSWRGILFAPPANFTLQSETVTTLGSPVVICRNGSANTILHMEALQVKYGVVVYTENFPKEFGPAMGERDKKRKSRKLIEALIKK